MDRSAVPVIDLRPALADGKTAEVAARLGEAIREVGFLQVVGHGIDSAVFHRLHDAAIPLWQQPPALLDTFASPIGHPFRGVTYEVNDAGHYRRHGLQNNRFWDAAEARAAGVDEAYLDFFGGNMFPPMPELASAYSACFEAMRGLGKMLVKLFGLELGLGLDGFDQAFHNDVSYLAVLNYPNVPGGQAGEIRNGEHSDSGALAMLHQRGNYEGLNVRLRSGERVTMPIIDEALVVNVGDLMARWTNDTWLATPHWVAGGGPGEARSTVVTHFLPSVETVIEPLESCMRDTESQYAPVRMYDWNDLYFAKKSRVLRLANAVR
jgi:isopenicillin N synthase-like dioxygenase